MEDILFQESFNPFEDTTLDVPIVHLRIQKRTVRKSITIVEGLDKSICKVVLKEFRKRFNTNGALKVDNDDLYVLQIQGDKRKEISDYLIEKEITDEDHIHIHGY